MLSSVTSIDYDYSKNCNQFRLTIMMTPCLVSTMHEILIFILIGTCHLQKKFIVSMDIRLFLLITL